MTVDLDVRVRTGTNPKQGGTPGYHQIILHDAPPGSVKDLTSVSRQVFGPNGEKIGHWNVNQTATTLAHETGHLLGLPRAPSRSRVT